MPPSVISFDETNKVFGKLFCNAGSRSVTAVNNADHYTPLAISKIAKKDSDQLMLALAHEVRNPLTNINLSVKLLESAIKDDELKGYLDIITRSSIRINNLIKEFLKQQMPGEVLPEKQSVQQLLDEVVEMTRDRIKLKNIMVRKDYAAPDIKILLNGPKMKMALTNIIINAIDSMDSENGELKLVTMSVAGKYVIQIEDNGCGISRQHLKKIFDPYFTRKQGGLGLGLATASDILHSNQVELKVESKEDVGTRFILSFEKDPWHKHHNAMQDESAGVVRAT
jgi:signal transduction histidine kinase